MKLIKAIVRPEKALPLKDILSGSGYHGITGLRLLIAMDMERVKI